MFLLTLFYRPREGCWLHRSKHRCVLLWHWVVVPVRGVGCIESCTTYSVRLDCCCPRKGCRLHPVVTWTSTTLEVIVPVRGVGCIGKKVLSCSQNERINWRICWIYRSIGSIHTGSSSQAVDFFGAKRHSIEGKNCEKRRLRTDAFCQTVFLTRETPPIPRAVFAPSPQ